MCKSCDCSSVIGSTPEKNCDSAVAYAWYEFEKSYKGDNDQTEKLCLMGGVPGFNDEVQYQLARSSGLIDQYEGIPVLSFKHKKINIGESYLFCTHRSITGNHDYVINPDQFAFYKDSESSAQIQKQCMNVLEKNTKE